MLKVLFVCSGNSSNFEIAPFIKVQGESLRDFGIDIQYFSIVGRGISGYLKEASRLRKFLKKNPIDIIHAHYTLSGWAVILSFPRQPVVLSLMGSDAYGDYIGPGKITFKSQYLKFLTYAIQPFVKSIISKSRNVERSVFRKNISYIIPNGILLDKINYEVNGFKEALVLNPVKKHVLFLGNQKSIRKNFKLLEAAISLIHSDDISLVTPYPVAHAQVVKYLNSVDVLVVPSLMEGSPNVVKEAMACNCPMVATDVGDIAWLFGKEPGHYLCSLDPIDVAEKLKMALEFSEKNGRTKGRDKIIEKGLDSETIAKRINNLYESVLDKNAKFNLR